MKNRSFYDFVDFVAHLLNGLPSVLDDRYLQDAQTVLMLNNSRLSLIVHLVE